ncbi:MAG: UDP-3-O-(3-hydroxymyristoyl)glucosamine N-acyltransferase [Lentisphaerae bacterium]|nr:UDP-3-O-(3-hydroxymyristoyl)glucosamine N-acyltransferase [Lentisphaerota bacterium]
MTLSVAEIARRLGAQVEGNAQAPILRLAGIREAMEGDLSFVATPHYAGVAATTRATAVIVNEDWNRPCSATLIRVKNADKAFAEAAQWFAPPAIVFPPGIHPTAIVAQDAKLGSDIFLGPYCIVEPGASIGDRSVICAHCYIGHGTIIGDDCKLYPHVSIREYTRLGSRVIIHNGAVIGSDGFGYVQEGAIRKKIPQIGIVVIGNDVEIGANVAIDRARFGQTRIGNGVKMDNLIQIAHNVIIGDNCVIVAQAGISGSTMIGDRTIIAGQAGIVGHLVLGSDVIVAAQSGVTKDIPAGTFVFGAPAMPYEKFTKLHAHLMRLPALKEKLSALEARLAKLEQARQLPPSPTPPPMA